MRRAIAVFSWVVYAALACLAVAVSGSPMYFEPSRAYAESLVCEDDETLTTYVHDCTDGTCTDLVCDGPDGSRREVSIYFILPIMIVMFGLAAVPTAITVIVSRADKRDAAAASPVIMPTPAAPVLGRAGSPAMRGKVLTIQGRDGPFVVQFEDDALDLDQKIAILEKAHEAGHLTDQQLGEAIDEVTRIAEWGE